MISLYVKGLKSYIYIDNLMNVDEENNNTFSLYDNLGHEIEKFKLKRLKQRKYFELCEDICESRTIIDFLMCLKGSYFMYDDFNIMVKRFTELNEQIKGEILIDVNTMSMNDFLEKYKINKIGSYYIIKENL